MELGSKLNFINQQIEKHRLSHAFLLETNNIDSCYQDVKNIVKKINCSSSFLDNCNKCNLCKLIDLNNLPSLITIRPDGMNIKRNQMEEVENKFSTKPIYSNYNVYVVLEADKMNESAENTMLKFLEEPEDNIIGFFITKNKENVLSTVKSRCEIAYIYYEENQNNNDELTSFVKEYLNLIFKDNDYLINKNYILSKYSTREEIEMVFHEIFNLLKNELDELISNGKKYENLIKKIEIVEKCLQLIKYNVNLELILDSFVIEMRKTNE